MHRGVTLGILARTQHNLDTHLWGVAHAGAPRGNGDVQAKEPTGARDAQFPNRKRIVRLRASSWAVPAPTPSPVALPKYSVLISVPGY